MCARSYYRDALRILFILVRGASALSKPDVSGAAAIFKGEARLHAFDFWMRNPDYLAEELLDLYNRTGEPRYLAAAEDIFTSEEPSIRRFPMIRYRFGAFEPLDDTLAVLCSRGLVKITGTKSRDRVRETDFLVMPSAFALAESITREYPILDWYNRRATLVVEVAGDRGGAALKHRQYEQLEYAETQMGGIIPPITQRVRERLLALHGESV